MIAALVGRGGVCAPSNLLIDRHSFRCVDALTGAPKAALVEAEKAAILRVPGTQGGDEPDPVALRAGASQSAL